MPVRKTITVEEEVKVEEVEEEIELGPQRTLLIKSDDGEFTIKIPEGWKITFGYFNPGNDKGYGLNRTALRIYESAEKQRACFLGVSEFRDLSLPIVRKHVAKSGAVSWAKDKHGSVRNEEESIEERWEKDDVEFN